MILLGHLRLVLGLRLLGLPRLKQMAGQFVSNRGGCLLFSGNRADIDKMHTVIHKRKLYFFTDGEYYTFRLNSDQTTVGLAQKNEMKKVENYTWQKEPGEEEGEEESKTVHFMDLQPKKKENSGGLFDNIGDGKLGRSKGIGTLTTTISREEGESSKVPNYGVKEAKNTKKKEEKARANMNVQREEVENEGIKTGRDIESDDYDSMAPGQFDLSVSTIDYHDRTFSLKKGELCLAYFKESFILTGCNTGAQNQVFGVVDVKEGTRRMTECMKHDRKIPERTKRENPGVGRSQVEQTAAKQARVLLGAAKNSNMAGSGTRVSLTQPIDQEDLLPEAEAQKHDVVGVLDNITRLLDTELR
ncbi:hypothetical protein ECANGB1_1581 [Enterospora canceri]|uniref:Uncharacterized protein n=1 Tax=Enterospora canceri TaxID=1081671 RepID=A0A1Y1S5P3_9MICR|nr:hypothetical protein ECANGB1_1581 [Enterospora canceri]